MQKHYDVPGSPGWHARRARCFNAGDASAALGCHPSGKTRTELLHELHTGIEREFSDYVQERVIDPGHRIEALWRPIAEAILGEDLQVLAGSLDVGLSRPIGASLDGITFMEDTVGECKSANDVLREALPYTGRHSYTDNDARKLPKGYRVQMEQQQLVTGATRTLFSACLFDAAGNVTEERHCFYTSDPALRAEILAAWRQIDADLADYQPPAAAAPKVVAEPVEALPAVFVKVEGSIVIRENFDAFEQAARKFIDTELVREPKTDDDFGRLEVQIKTIKQARGALKEAEAGWIAQIEPVSAAKRRKDLLDDLLQKYQSLSERVLKEEKERRRGEIVAGGIGALQQHVAALNKRLGGAYMPAIPADFGGAIKGMRSLASMEDAVATTLANAKIAANEVADRIQINMQALVAAGDRAHFPDVATLVLKAPDDLRAVIAQRVAETERKLEAERARIRQEEEARARAHAQREQQERQEAEDALIASFHAASRRIEGDSVPYIQKAITAYESTAKDWENDPRERVRSAYLAGRAYLKDRLEAAERRQREEAAAREQRQREEEAARAEQQRLEAAAEEAQRRATAAPAAANVLPMPTKAPPAAPTLRLGVINERMQRCKVTAEDLAALGFPAAGRDRSAVLFHEADWPYIVTALIVHLTKVRDGQQQAA